MIFVVLTFNVVRLENPTTSTVAAAAFSTLGTSVRGHSAKDNTSKFGQDLARFEFMASNESIELQVRNNRRR